jgi:molecular chaperone GrpE
MSRYDWQRHDQQYGQSAPAGEGNGARAESNEAAKPSEASETAGDERPRTIEQALDMIDRLRDEVAARSAELATAKDQLLRERAELENFKRRMQREKSEALRYASEHLLRDILPVLDNLERAIDAATAAETGGVDPATQASRMDALVTGIKMVLHQFMETLGRFGVSRVSSTGEAFDPSHHEAVAHVETDEQPAGAVVDEHAPGYRLHERLLRPAQVTVAKAKRGKH